MWHYVNEETPLIMNYRNSGLEVKSYRYYDPKTCGFDAVGAYEDLNVSPPTQLYTPVITLRAWLFLSLNESCEGGDVGSPTSL